MMPKPMKAMVDTMFPPGMSNPRRDRGSLFGDLRPVGAGDRSDVWILLGGDGPGDRGEQGGVGRDPDEGVAGLQAGVGVVAVAGQDAGRDAGGVGGGNDPGLGGLEDGGVQLAGD